MVIVLGLCSFNFFVIVLKAQHKIYPVNNFLSVEYILLTMVQRSLELSHLA